MSGFQLMGSTESMTHFNAHHKEVGNSADHGIPYHYVLNNVSYTAFRHGEHYVILSETGDYWVSSQTLKDLHDIGGSGALDLLYRLIKERLPLRGLFEVCVIFQYNGPWARETYYEIKAAMDEYPSTEV